MSRREALQPDSISEQGTELPRIPSLEAHGRITLSESGQRAVDLLVLSPYPATSEHPVELTASLAWTQQGTTQQRELTTLTHTLDHGPATLHAFSLAVPHDAPEHFVVLLTAYSSTASQIERRVYSSELESPGKNEIVMPELELVSQQLSPRADGHSDFMLEVVLQLPAPSAAPLYVCAYLPHVVTPYLVSQTSNQAHREGRVEPGNQTLTLNIRIDQVRLQDLLTNPAAEIVVDMTHAEKFTRKQQRFAFKPRATASETYPSPEILTPEFALSTIDVFAAGD